MSLQRRRGLPVTFEKTKIVTDARGNPKKESDPDNVIHTTCAFIPDRGSRAEVPGQNRIDVATIIVAHDLPGVEIWSKVHVRGQKWDIVTPPQYHHGTRRVRHWSMEVRVRPHDG